MAIVNFYVPNKWQGAGDTGADATQMEPPYNTGLLHLINYLMHTEDGRAFMHTLIPGQGSNTVASVRQALLVEYAKFSVNGPAAEALVGAHIAGFAWVDAHNNNNVTLRDEQELVYKQHLAAVSWFLWDEGQQDMFSLGW